MHNEKARKISAGRILRFIMSAFFAVLGIAALTAIIYICTHYTNALPQLTFTPDQPRARVAAMMDCICDGDLSGAEAYMLSNPDLGVDKEPKDEISALTWYAFADSLSYSFSGDCHPTEDGLSQPITFTCLDILSITSNLKERSQTLLTERVEQAENVSEIYDENNEYREDVVREMLALAVQDALKEDAKMLTTEVEIDLKYRDGEWWIQADQELLDVLFGDVLFYSG